MIVLIGGTKGGSGKTTIATNLAVMRANQKKSVLLVDADDQESASGFTMLRNECHGEAGYTSVKLTGKAVRTETKRLKDNYDDVIIDAGGRDTASQRAALSIADILLIPFPPRTFDIWTIENMSSLVEEMREANLKLKAYTFLNKTDPRGADNADAAERLREEEHLVFLDITIGNRKAFGNAAGHGQSVTETKPIDEKASQEIQKLYDHVWN